LLIVELNNCRYSPSVRGFLGWGFYGDIHIAFSYKHGDVFLFGQGTENGLEGFLVSDIMSGLSKRLNTPSLNRHYKI